MRLRWPHFLMAWGDKGGPRKSWFIVAFALLMIGVGISIGYWRTPPGPHINENTVGQGTPSAAPSADQTVTPQNVPDSPGTQSSAPQGSNATTSQPVKTPKLVSYTIQEGDTLTAIAEKFSTSVESIVSINGLTSPDRLSLGDKITIMQDGKGTVRRVGQGDTLWDIARTYGVTVDDIVKANSLKDANDISPGQLLMLPNAKPSLPGALLASRSSVFSWPISGSITDTFGWRVHPITGNRQYHEGLDIAAPYGSSIRAAGSGTVSYAGWMSGYGKLVIIKHGNGVETRYGHLSRIAVSNGERVSSGEIIGYVGQTGDATGPHVHFEVRVDGVPQNPRKYLP